MNKTTKQAIENSLDNFFDKSRRTKEQNQEIIEIAKGFMNLAKNKGVSKIELIGSTATNLAISDKSKRHNVNAILIWNEVSKTDLVSNKFKLINDSKKYGKQKYQNIKVDNKKSVVSIKFLNNINDYKFSLDFALAKRDSNGNLSFIYSKKPEDPNEYKFSKNESLEMVEKFNQVTNNNPNIRKATIILKSINENKIATLNNNKHLPSSFITEIVIKQSKSSIVDLIMDSLSEIKDILKAKIKNNKEWKSSFEPKLDYLRKIELSQLQKIQEFIGTIINSFKKALSSESIEEAIIILKAFFDDLEPIDDPEASGGGSSGRAG